MNRRVFLQRAATGAVVLALPDLSPFMAGRRMGVVVHSYGNRWNAKVSSAGYPGFATALDLLDHCHQIGAGGVQVVTSSWTAKFAKSVRVRQEKLGMFVEGSLGLPKKSAELASFEQDLMRAKEAGIQVVRTVCSSGRRYENLHSPEAFADLKKNALTSLQLVEPVLRKHSIRLAVENHKDWRAQELVGMLKQLNSEWIGVTLDFGNNMALMEDPMTVVETLAPYVFTTHVKDMGAEDYPDGFLLSEVPLGKGLLDLPRMIDLCRQYNPEVTFNLEMITRDPLEIPCLRNDYWATFADVPGTDLARMLHAVRQQKAATALPRVSQLGIEDRLAAEEQNIVACLAYSQERLGLR